MPYWAIVTAAVISWSGEARARVAFVGLDGLGMEPTLVEPFEQLLEHELSRLAQGDFLPPAGVTAALLEPELERLRSCGGDADCLLDLGGVLEVQFVVYGTLTELGENYVLVLRAVDVQTGAERPRIRRQLEGERDALIETMRDAATELLAVDSLRGLLRISTDPAGAAVQVDGAPVSLEDGLVEVAVGQHTVLIEAPGFETASRIVAVGAEGETRLEATLTRVGAGDSTFMARWWPALVAGAGAASFGVAGYFGYRTADLEQQMKRGFRRYEMTEVEFRQTRDDGESAALWTNVTLALGSVLVSTAVVGWLLSDEAMP